MVVVVITPRTKTERTHAVKPPTLAALHEPLRGTVFIDLRKSEEQVEEERNKIAIVQRVLKINSKQWVN